MSAIGTTAIRGSGTPRSQLSHYSIWASLTKRSGYRRGSETVSRSGPDGTVPPLSIMYRVDGSSDLKEESLDHLDGYMGSRPVRIGNGAADQLQLDIYGEAIDSIQALDKIVPCIGDRGWGVTWPA